MIGLKCKKTRKRGKEPKPFKSKSKINTIKGITVNPNTDLPAFTFEEDTSCVDFRSVILLDDDLEEIGQSDIARQRHVILKRTGDTAKQRKPDEL